MQWYAWKMWWYFLRKHWCLGVNTAVLVSNTMVFEAKNIGIYGKYCCIRGKNSGIWSKYGGILAITGIFFCKYSGILRQYSGIFCHQSGIFFWGGKQLNLEKIWWYLGQISIICGKYCGYVGKYSGIWGNYSGIFGAFSGICGKYNSP